MSVLVAIGLYSRAGIDAYLYRDDAIYAYGGQQLTHGVAPYVSIFDPKGPLPTMLCALGAWAGQVLGHNDVLMMRLVYFACAVLTVLAVYLLVRALWNSVLGCGGRRRRVRVLPGFRPGRV